MTTNTNLAELSRAPLILRLVAISILLIPLLPFFPEFWTTLLVFTAISGLVALGLVLLTGVGGMTSFGQAAFVGLGAYCAAVLSTRYGWSPWLTLPMSLAVTGGFAFVVGFVTVRLSGHFLPLGTIAWGIAFFYLFGKIPFLGGSDGIQRIPPLSIAGFDLLTGRSFYPIALIAVFAAIVATRNLLDSRTGRAIRALRNNAAAAESCGVSIWRLKLTVFVYAAMLAGIAGWLYAHFLRTVSPSAFGIGPSIEYLLMAVVGGVGSIYGAFLGAALILSMKNVLQDVLPTLFGVQGSFEGLVFGVLLVVFLQKASGGIYPAIARFFPSIPAKPYAIAPTANNATFTNQEAPVLSVDSATKRFGGLVAVNGVSFEVLSRQIVCLIGPNGAGKSTTFDLISGVTGLSSGAIRLSNARIDLLDPTRVAAQRVARTFQHVKLNPDVSVLENVALGAHLQGNSGEIASILRLNRLEEQRLLGLAMRNIHAVGLGEVAATNAGELALGQQRLVEIARALCLDPILLLLDEPAAGLRHGEKQALASLLSGLRTQGISILLVEHDIDFVMGLADHVVVLDFGTKIAEGTPSTIRQNREVIAAYLGSEA